MEGDVTLTNGAVVRCRQDSSTMWMIVVVPKSGHFAKVLGMERPTFEEKDRWSIAIHATYGAAYGYQDKGITYERRPAGVSHPDGWFTVDQSYRNEADEAAVIARWRERTGQ